MPWLKGNGKQIFTEAVEMPASVNQIKKRKPMDKPSKPTHGRAEPIHVPYRR
jgi:hypothetical protein